MTPRERVLAAMHMQKPDRVPVMCQLSIGHMLQQLDVSASEFWFDAATFADGLVQLRKTYNFDGILVSLHGHGKNWRDDLRDFSRDGEREILTFDDRKLTFGRDDLPEVEYLGDQPLVMLEDIVPGDLPDVIDYIPVSYGLHYHLDTQNNFEIFKLLSDRVGDTYSIHGEVTSPFDYFLDLLGYENGLIALYDDPDKCKAILQRYTEGIAALAEQMCRENIDAIKMSSPFAGMGFISPDHYQEFIVPYESQIYQTITNAGKQVYIHTCGAINDRLEAMQGSGASGLECLDPAPLGNVDLGEAIERIGKHMFIKGNLDSVNMLLQGSDEEVLATVKESIATGQTAAGYILSTACAVAPYVKKERLQLLSTLAREHGNYA